MNEAIERLGWVLLHSLWEFSLVAVSAAAISCGMRRRSAAVRYVLLVTAMGAMIGGSVATWLLLPSDGPLPSVNQAASGVGWESLPTRPQVEREVPMTPQPELLPSVAPDSVDPVAIERVPNAALINDKKMNDKKSSAVGMESQSTALELAAVLRPWLSWIVAVWGVGVVTCSLRPLVGWHAMRRLRRVGVSPVGADVLGVMQRLVERLGWRRAVSVMQSTLTQVPVVVGYFKPVILLPVSLMTSLSVEQLEAVLAHELAHVRRHDFVVNLLQTLVETLCFYHPAVWWLSHQIRVEREHCCDDLVVQWLGNRVEYGRALVAIEELRAEPSLLALGIADGSMLARVRRILVVAPERATARAIDRWPVTLVTLGCLLLAGFGAFVSSQADVDLAAAQQKNAEELAAEKLAWDELDSMKVTTYGEAFSRRSSLAHLRRLEKTTNFPEAGLKELREQTEKPIREADFWSVPAKAWPHIGRLQSLEKLSITASDLRGEPMQQIAKLHRLREFRAVNSKLVPQDLAELRQLKDIERIEVMFTVFDESAQARKKAMGELTAAEQELADRVLAKHPEREHIVEAAILTDRAIEPLRDLQRLRSIKLINTFVSRRGVQVIAALPLVEELELSVVDESPEVVRLIGDMKSLKRLSGLSVTDDALAAWVGLSQLESLGQYAGDVTDRAVDSLLKLSQLRHLMLWHNQLTDDGLLRLAELPQLEELDVRFSKTLSKSGIERFQALKPDCRVAHDGKAEAKVAEEKVVSTDAQASGQGQAAAADEKQTGLEQTAEAASYPRVIRGKVTNAEGKPVAGALIEWGPEYPQDAPRESVRSGDDGTYRLEAQKAGGKFKLGVSASGCAPAIFKGIVPGPRSKPSDLDVKLLAETTLRIEIVDETKRPISKLDVLPMTPQRGFNSSFSMVEQPEPIPGHERPTACDAQGVCQLRQLLIAPEPLLKAEPGDTAAQAEWKERTNHEGWLSLRITRGGKWVHEHAVSRAAFFEAKGVMQIVVPDYRNPDIEAKYDGTIFGQVVDAEGQPVRSYQVTLRHRPEAKSVNAADGKFEWGSKLNPSRSYEVRVFARGFAPQTVRITPQDTQREQPQRIELKPHASAEFVLLDEVTRKPIPHVVVVTGLAKSGRNYIEWNDLGNYADGHHGLTNVLRVTSDAEGRFSVPEGDDAATLLILTPGYARTIVTPKLRPARNEQGLLPISLQRGASIRGVVAKNSRLSGHAGREVWLNTNAVHDFEPMFHNLKRDDKGECLIESLAPGEYSVALAHSDGNMSTACWSKKITLKAGEQKIVPLGEMTGTLTLRGRTSPFTDVSLTHKPRAGAAPNQPVPDGLRSVATISDVDGNFELPQLEAGNYSIELGRLQHFGGRGFGNAVKGPSAIDLSQDTDIDFTTGEVRALSQVELKGRGPLRDAPQFSEATEVVLSMGSLKYMLDLDGGQTMDPPQVYRAEQKKMDVCPLDAPLNQAPAGLQGMSLRGLRVKPDDWSAEATLVQKRLADEKVAALTKLPFDKDEQATYFFRTADGAEGVLQLLAHTDDPKGIRLRYKRLVGSKLNSQVKVGMTFDEVIAIKGRHYRLSHGMKADQIILVYDDIAIAVDSPPNAKNGGKVTGFEPGLPREVVQDVPYADEEVPQKEPTRSQALPGNASPESPPQAPKGAAPQKGDSAGKKGTEAEPRQDRPQAEPGNE